MTHSFLCRVQFRLLCSSFWGLQLEALSVVSAQHGEFLLRFVWLSQGPSREPLILVMTPIPTCYPDLEF